MSAAHSRPSRLGEPAWEIARMFPEQGAWSEEDYFALSDRNWLVEFADGHVEVLPMPTKLHQFIVAFLYRALDDFVVAGGLGAVLFAPYRLRVRAGKFREPDVIFLAGDRADRAGEQFSDGADLVMEVISASNRAHDTEVKRAEYAQMRIPEYWLIDPEVGSITVLVLEPGATAYSLHGCFSRGERATSRLLAGFEVDVTRALIGRR